MKVSTGTIAVWQLAAQEAIAASFKEIQPEHLLEALLKFSDLNHDQARRAVTDLQVATRLCSEIDSVRYELMKRSIKGSARRTIRKRLGLGGNVYTGGTVHRSAGSRALFDAAAQLAAQDRCAELAPSYLLKAVLASSAQMIQELVKEIARSDSGERILTPQLDRWGKELWTSTDAHGIGKDEDNPPEVKVLLQILCAPDKPGVWLVTDHAEFAHAVVAGAASFMVDKRNTYATHIIDVTSLGSIESDTEAIDVLRTLAREAAQLPGLVLYLPAIGTSDQAGRPDKWMAEFKHAMLQKGVQCICPVGTEAYRRHLAGDITLKRVTRPIWLYSSRHRRLPSRL